MKRPEYLLILAGDHIYKMNYADMCRLSPVEDRPTRWSAQSKFPLSEASRFGVITVDENGRISGSMRNRRSRNRSPRSFPGVRLDGHLFVQDGGHP